MESSTPQPQSQNASQLISPRLWIAAAALSGAAVVALGAFGAHALKYRLDQYGHSLWAKAVLYQIFHTGAIFGVALLGLIIPTININRPAFAFYLGILLFSGSLYLLALTGISSLGIITPFGGLSFITGWLLLALAALRRG